MQEQADRQEDMGKLLSIEQARFEGFPLVGVRFSLASVRELPSNIDLAFEQLVSGRFSGRVKGRHERRDGKGWGEEARYAVTWEIEVLEAELD